MKLPLSLGLFLYSLMGLAQNVTIPDANFKAALVADNLVNTNGNGEIQLTEAQNAISIYVVNANVSDVTGLEEFTNLLYLALDTNNLSVLDVSRLTKTQSLTCRYNQLTSLDVTNNPALLYLYCGSNRLTSLETPPC